MVSLTWSLWHGLFDTVELRFPGINRPFDYHFANLRIFFKSCKILLYLYLLFLKLVHFCMFIVQNSSKNLLFYKFLVFSKIPREISKFLIYWDCPHYVWMRKEIKFFIDLFLNSVIYNIFHSDFAIQFMNKSVFAENIFRGNIVFRSFEIRRCRCSKSR